MMPDDVVEKARRILAQTRQAIQDAASDDPDVWWYVNRFVFARLNLDERSTKTKIKKDLLDNDPMCHACGQRFNSRRNVHLHRMDGNRGYRPGNCVLMHQDCHNKWHTEHAAEEELGHDPTLVKWSKRHEDKPYTYWWDISPGLAKQVDRYENVEFVKKDTGERCIVPAGQLQVYLKPDRQTTRGTGNWGIKVLSDRPDELAFEPGKRGQQWHFLPVVWIDEERED